MACIFFKSWIQCLSCIDFYLESIQDKTEKSKISWTRIAHGAKSTISGSKFAISDLEALIDGLLSSGALNSHKFSARTDIWESRFENLLRNCKHMFSSFECFHFWESRLWAVWADWKGLKTLEIAMSKALRPWTSNFQGRTALQNLISTALRHCKLQLPKP